MIDPTDSRSQVVRDFHRLYYDGLGGAPPQKRISGPCLLLKRSVLEAIGGLDEPAASGPFDEEDLSRRVKQSGFRLAIAHDLFVHHITFGNADAS